MAVLHVIEESVLKGGTKKVYRPGFSADTQSKNWAIVTHIFQGLKPAKKAKYKAAYRKRTGKARVTQPNRAPQEFYDRVVFGIKLKKGLAWWRDFLGDDGPELVVKAVDYWAKFHLSPAQEKLRQKRQREWEDEQGIPTSKQMRAAEALDDVPDRFKRKKMKKGLEWSAKKHPAGLSYAAQAGNSSYHIHPLSKTKFKVKHMSQHQKNTWHPSSTVGNATSLSAAKLLAQNHANGGIK